MTPKLKRAVWILNTAGFILFLLWLASMSDRNILREQDGIIYFFPCLPFLFVYLLLIGPKPQKKEEADAEKPPPPDGQTPADG